jgi:hypothetical protein
MYIYIYIHTYVRVCVCPCTYVCMYIFILVYHFHQHSSTLLDKTNSLYMVKISITVIVQFCEINLYSVSTWIFVFSTVHIICLKLCIMSINFYTIQVHLKCRSLKMIMHVIYITPKTLTSK